MNVTIDKHLGGSVFNGHGALPLSQGQVVDIEVLVKYDEVERTAQLHLDEARPTMVQDKQVLKYTMAKTKNVPMPEAGHIIPFNKFFVNIKK
jgi:hypothetical protein